MKITNVICPQSKYSIKCPYEMTPEYITVHNTYNDASAMSEVSYMLGNNLKTSFHAAVDNERIVTGIPFNRNGWHAGDGKNGTGNRKSIGIEICYSKSGGERFIQAEKLAAEYIAYLLKQYGWGLDRVKKHQDWSGKYCPHRTLDMGWQRFLNIVASYYNKKPEYKPEVKSENIKEIQQWLNDTYGFNLSVNGKADNTLKEAVVIAWKTQCNKNWNTSFASDKYGRVESGTFGDSSKEIAKKVTRSKGDSGKMVKLIQALCWFYGYNNNTFSGNYGNGTVEDVHNFKTQHGLSEDGTSVGQGFWTKTMA